MANVVSGNTVKLNNGQSVQAQNGGWYDGQQFFNGSLSNPGQIHPESNQQGAGQAVSQEVIAQTNPANVNYVNQQRAAVNLPPSPTVQNPTPVQPEAIVVNNPSNPGSSSGGTPAVASTPTYTGNSSPFGGGAVSLPTAPTFDLKAATESAYNTPEIATSNKTLSDLQAKVTARQQALADAQAGINDNPFYSEATRVGKSQQLTQQANADMQVLDNQLNIEQNKLSSLKADAAIKVNAAMGQYNINEQAYKDNLTNFSNLVSAGALDNASAGDIANLSVQTGIPTSMIRSIQQNSIKKNNPLQISTSTNNNGDLTVLAVNSQGKVINQTTIAGAGKTSTTKAKVQAEGNNGGKTTSNNKNLAASFATNASTIKRKKINGTDVGQFPQLVMNYAPEMSLQDIYKAYMNTNLGKKYGAPTESVTDIKAIYNYYRNGE